MMRIISGTHKKYVINPPKGIKARPTTDFAKENIFNVLSNYFYFEELEVLDLFSGTGSISFEFASRGARRVVAIEINNIHHKFIQEVSKKLNLSVLKAIQTNVFVYLRQMQHEKFDIIFADPPYDMDGRSLIVDTVLQSNMLKSDGWFILEHSAKDNYKEYKNFVETRKYGSVNFSIFDNKRIE